ncbi:MAG: thioredoxin-disulfide reductase [Bacteroidia bacterium]|nr:thioredoxin-disulfide reductase [Bacteroidia bacterium]MCX7763696.1 thioredoxin-disulfide reductase [Bacteroidia bacterium]MDW8057023.1 thioredoxin-disulfide reductase [Bacteroidia bacterium]
MTYDVAIIGSGPAGYTAAIYAARAGLKLILIAGPEPGGQLTKTSEVENFPGYPNGILGPEMMEDFRKQAERFGTPIIYDMVEKAELRTSPKVLWLSGGDEIHAEAVIIATGSSPKWLGLEAERRLYGAGVSACAVCDGFFYRGQPVAVVGGGDTACEEALYLSKLCSEVHMLVRRDEMRASKVMQDRVKNTPNIHIHWNTVTVDILGERFVEGVRVQNRLTGEEKVIPIKGFFVAIGHQPNTEIFRGQVDLDAQGYIITKPKSTETNLEGVFAAGDVQDPVYRQAITAAASGCMAALDAERWLTTRKHLLHTDGTSHIVPS